MPAVEPEATLTEPRPIFRLAVDAYHRILDAGIFDEEDPVELIDGE